MSVETTAPSTATRPLTGEEYLESIRDRREIYCYGGALTRLGQVGVTTTEGAARVVGPCAG